MATLTHAAFRSVVEKSGGCDEYYSEMINAGTFVTGGPFEKYYVIPDPAPEKMVWQITGRKTEHIVRAAEMIAALPGSGIDINMGCSAPEIMRSGAGAAWLTRDRAETREMISGVCNALQHAPYSAALGICRKAVRPVQRAACFNRFKRRCARRCFTERCAQSSSAC